MPAPSTFPTPSATPPRAEFGALIAGINQHVPNIGEAVIVRPWTQRSRFGRGQLPRGGKKRCPPARMHHQWHRRAGWQCLPRGAGDGACMCAAATSTPSLGARRTAPRRSQPCVPKRSPRPPVWSPISPEWWCSPTRPSLVPMLSPMNPASTRTAFSRIASPTKSLTPKPSGSVRQPHLTRQTQRTQRRAGPA